MIGREFLKGRMLTERTAWFLSYGWGIWFWDFPAEIIDKMVLWFLRVVCTVKVLW